MNDRVPLICDPPPGRIFALSVPGRLDKETMDHIRRQWDEAIRTGTTVVLDSSITVHVIEGGSGGWPDWEHCAA